MKLSKRTLNELEALSVHGYGDCDCSCGCSNCGCTCTTSKPSTSGYSNTAHEGIGGEQRAYNSNSAKNGPYR